MPVPVRELVVVDSNSRSRGGLAAALAAASAGGPTPLIPDALVVEMMKVEGSARAWAGVLGAHPAHFAMARAPGAVVRDEIDGVAEPPFINRSGTTLARTFVEDYRDNGEAALPKYMAAAQQALSEVRAGDSMFNAGFIRDVSQPAINRIIESMPPADVKALREAKKSGLADQDREEIKARLSRHRESLELVAAQMAKETEEESKLVKLVHQPTLTRAGAVLTLAEIVDKLDQGHTIRGLADTTLVNDAVDSQGVLFSALCVDFMTKDTRSLRLHALVRGAMGLKAGRL